MYASVTGKSNLNVVLCGADAGLKVNFSRLLRGRKPSHQTKFSSVYVKKEERIHGHQISVVELPTLSRLSEDEAMHQSLHCLSLCDPGVHVFLIIVPVGPLTDKDKAEVEKIQKIFYSSENFMVIFTSEVTVDRRVTDSLESYPESKSLIRDCGGRYKVIGLKEHEKSKQTSLQLLYYIQDMKTEPYTLQMYVRAQEKRVRDEYEEKRSEMMRKNKELQLKISSYGIEEEQEDLKHLRIVLFGKTGSGKSATGNTILGRNEFLSQLSRDSVTTVCEQGVCEVDGRSVTVVDTPGLFDTTLPNDQVLDEIMKCVSLSSPGPHAFIIVLSVGRFTREESNTIKLIRKMFGPKVTQFSIILFTRGDYLKGKSIEDFVKRIESADLNKLIRDCGDRYLTFNNETQDKTQVTKLIKMIEEMKTTNHGRYFTNIMFEEAEMSIQKKMEEILKEKEREIDAEKEEIKAKHEIEKENMKKRLEEEKRKADEEKVKMENKFKEQEETLRKELEEKEKAEQKKRHVEKQKQLEEEKQQRAEYDQKIEEMKREIEQQRSQYEKREKEKEEEDRKREEKYRQDQEKMKAKEDLIRQLQKKQEEENKKRDLDEQNRSEQEERERKEKYRQDQEKMKAKEDLIIQLQKKQEEENKKRDLDEQKRSDQEEKERKELADKIRVAENDRREIQEEIKRQQTEWEEEKKRHMREREDDERKRRERHEDQLREKQKELEKTRKKFEKEREEERQKREEETQKERQEKEQKEREYEEKKNEMMKHYEKLEQERKEEWERKRREDDERREEERKRWEKRIEDIKREKEEEIRRREIEIKENEKKKQEEREEMKKEHELKIKEMKKKHEDEARKQAEEYNEFREEHVKGLKQMLEERQKQHELLEKLYQHFKEQKGEEIRELKKEIEELKNNSLCGIL